MVINILVLISLFIPFVAFAQSRMEPLSLLRDDKSLIHYYLERISKTDVSEVLLLIIQGSDCNSVSHNKSIHDEFRNVWPSADLLTDRENPSEKIIADMNAWLEDKIVKSSDILLH